MASRPPVHRHIRKLVGELTSENYELLERVVFAEIDDVIGLDIMIDETADGAGDQGGLVAGNQDDRMVIYKVSDEGGSEIIINGHLSRQWAMWRADGFYSVKSGGMQQGVISVGLIPVEQALVLLNPAVKIITIKLEAPSA